MHDETSNEVRSMLIEVGWKKSSHSPSSVLRGSWRGPLRKDEGFDHGHTINRLQTKARSDAPMHQGDCAMIKQVESPQVQHSASRTSSRRDAMWHSSHSTAFCSSVTPFSTRCSDTRKERRNEQVARGQGAQDGETERDEHPERKSGWNSRSEATGAARSEQLRGAQDLPQGLAMGTFASSDRTRRWTCSVRPCTSTGDNKNRLHQTCRPVNQFEHVCVEKCPLTMRHTAIRGGDSCGESQRLSFGGSAPRRPKRDSRNTVTIMLKPFARARGRRECESRSNQALETRTSTHRAGRGRRVVLVSPADHAQHPKVRAEEQRVSEHAETNTWVSTWTSEQLVETAKPLTQPRLHTAQVV